MIESKWRSAAKTVTWRITGTCSTLFISYVTTGNLVVAGSIAGIQFVANLILYYAHERVWAAISWKNKQ